ncbi:hypothetical protein [Endozoicomonas sp. ISHI1]|uniref:hypothetical protein n=1 Tax=Endozoicomonas sp. ISHI1 TaxID=2825882 RepID=UPI002148FCCB|nr:hypothetical protein [Endozoicomonas sp. ISHI1]
MNKNQCDSLSKLFYDLVKVPLALCMLGPLVPESPFLFELEVFGSSLVLLFGYIA